MLQGKVPQCIDWVKVALLVRHVVTNVASGGQAGAPLPVVDKILSLSVGQIDSNGGRSTPSFQ